jgi:hypothetical protein
MISPVSLFSPVNTRPKAPMPTSSPRVHENGGCGGGASGGATASADGSSRSGSVPGAAPAAPAAMRQPSASAAPAPPPHAAPAPPGGVACAPPPAHAAPLPPAHPAPPPPPAPRSRSGEPEFCGERLRPSALRASCCSCCARSAAVNTGGACALA